MKHCLLKVIGSEDRFVDSDLNFVPRENAVIESYERQVVRAGQVFGSDWQSRAQIVEADPGEFARFNSRRAFAKGRAVRGLVDSNAPLRIRRKKRHAKKAYKPRYVRHWWSGAGYAVRTDKGIRDATNIARQFIRGIKRGTLRHWLTEKPLKEMPEENGVYRITGNTFEKLK